MPQREPWILKKLSFNVTVGGISCIAVISVSASYFFFPDHRGGISFISAALGAGAAIYAGYYIGKTLHLQVHRDKIARGFEFLFKIDTADMSKIIAFIEKEWKDHDFNDKQFCDKILEDKDLRSQVTLILGLFEDMSIAVQYGYADEEVLFTSMDYLAPYIYEKLFPYIKHIRTSRRDDRYCKELMRLVDKWKVNTLLSTGERNLSSILRQLHLEIREEFTPFRRFFRGVDPYLLRGF